MASVNKMRSWTTVILHLFSHETDLFMKVIIKCVNTKLWDILGCFHYILNAPRISNSVLEVRCVVKELHCTYLICFQSKIIMHSCINFVIQSCCLKPFSMNENPCSNHEIHVLFEHGP